MNMRPAHRNRLAVPALAIVLAGLLSGQAAYADPEPKSVYVQPGLPSKPFSFDVYLYDQNAYAVFGLNGSQAGPNSSSATVFGGQVPSLTGAAGIMGITNMTVINQTDTGTSIFYSAPYFNIGTGQSPGSITTSCATSFVRDFVQAPTGNVWVPAHSTVSIPFPTPLVINPGLSAPCFAISGPYPGVGGFPGVEVTLSGFVN